ncbi:MAG: protein-methionine-sulfoxide reductase catalytic subunit MsrP [Oceanospirillaceae bacterium]|nr:protein-methionine-sulfoxide reductase catalytic subunit MsrP [Oceanospirillaceae bacterium]
MLIKQRQQILSSEITSESVYKQRRVFMKSALGLAGAIASSNVAALTNYPQEDDSPKYPGPNWLQDKLQSSITPSGFQAKDKLTPYKDVISYNNFYEFGFDKSEPAKRAQKFITDPWKVEISGEVGKPGVYNLEDFVQPHTLEERIYRMRCVEGWSMVIPWVGIPLADVLKRFEPTSKAKYVEFTTLHDPKQMPQQNSLFGTLDWPYVEGLRMDEAMNPLAFLATGLYGQGLPPQNGAPLRLVVPWKYGFKNIKSIVKIRFTEHMPVNTWNKTAPREYGFYANVNPEVDHPRWSQATERRLPSSLFSPNRIETLPFYGYAEQVAHLYKGMDLTKWI